MAFALSGTFMGDLQEPNITLAEEERLVKSPSSDLNPSRIGAERWAIAEKSTQKIISQVQPTVVSEKRRIAVIDYVRRLIRNCNSCEVRILLSHTYLYL